MKNLILPVLFILVSIYAQSQNLIEFGSNEMKYWKLRGRLVGDGNNKDIYNGFMTPGGSKGMSIPAASRHPTYTRENYYFNPLAGGGCSQQTIDGIQVYAEYDNLTGNLKPGYPPLVDPRDGNEVKGLLIFSDNSIIKIGYYLGVLATEWALLRREGASTEQTEKEIYYALATLDRLDLNAENLYQYPGSTASPSINGFLMRNDVDEKFQLNTTGKNIDLVNSSIACMDDGHANCSESNAYVKIANAMSQDEVIGMLMGFALMKKMLPEYVSYNGQGLRNWSRQITERVVEYVREGGATNFWAIVDPAEQRRVCRGSKAIWNSFGIAAVAEYICGGTITFQNSWSLSIGKLAWNFQKDHYAMNNVDIVWGLGMPTSMQTALGLNAYEAIVVPGIGNGKSTHDGAYNVTMFLNLLACSKTAQRAYPPFMDITGKALINTVSQTYLKNLYELLGSVIYGYYPVQNEAYWRNEFNKLNCGCNCMQGNNVTSWQGCENYLPDPPGGQTNIFPSNPWSTENRWAFAMEQTGDANTLREYNGLDYMLAFNLYRWKYFSGGYSSRVRTNCHHRAFPFQSEPNPHDQGNTYALGSTTYPFEQKTVFSINTWSTDINQSANVTFSAGSDIKLLPGFHAKPGAIFKAHIKEYDCEPVVIPVPNSSYVSWKNGVDSFYNSYFDFDIDTTISIQVDADSSVLYDAGPDYDSNVLVMTYTNGVDTFLMDIGPDYTLTSDGEIIYTPQGGNNKSDLGSITIKGIKLYPNPTSGSLYLHYTLYESSDINIQVLNHLGQVIPVSGCVISDKQEKGVHTICMQTSYLTSGVYICAIQINGRREVKRFTIKK